MFACAGDFGWVTRPRLWWLSVKWSPEKGWLHRLQLNTPRKAVTDFYMGGYSFHADVASGRKHMPCATTPAPADKGRPAPKSSRGSMLALQARGNAHQPNGRNVHPWHHRPRRCRARLPYQDAPHYNGVHLASSPSLAHIGTLATVRPAAGAPSHT